MHGDVDTTLSKEYYKCLELDYKTLGRLYEQLRLSIPNCSFPSAKDKDYETLRRLYEELRLSTPNCPLPSADDFERQNANFIYRK